MACKSTSEINCNQIALDTKFSRNQILHIFNFYKKYANPETKYMTYDGFKKSLGVLGGTNSNDYISNRMFEVISENRKNLSFEQYVNFLNLVNYGSYNEKLLHTFQLFDLDNDNKITKDDFCTVILNICELLSTVNNSQIKISKGDIENIFNEILEKTDTGEKYLDFETFKTVNNQYPELIDYFDIFHNKLSEEQFVSLSKKKYKILKENLFTLREIIEKIKTAREAKDKYIIPKKEMEEITINSAKSPIISQRNTNIKEYSNITERNKKNSKEKNYCKFDDIVIHANDKYMEYTNITNKNSLKFYNSNININNVIKINQRYETPSNKNNSHRSQSEIETDYKRKFSVSGKIIPNIMNQEKSTKSDIHEEIEDLDFSNDDDDINNTSDKGDSRSNNDFNDIGFKSHNKNTNIEETEYNNTIVNNQESESEDTDLEFIKIKKFSLANQSEKGSVIKSLDNHLIVKNPEYLIEKLADIEATIKELWQDLNINSDNQLRRKGIRLNIKNRNDINAEDFLNSYNANPSDEKGLIHFGNDNVKLVLNMMIGIKRAVSSVSDGTSNSFYKFKNDNAFFETNIFNFTDKDSNDPSSHLKDLKCVFSDYAPKMFYNIRKIYGIKDGDYLKSLGPENFLGNLIMIRNRSLRELISSGKSGSFFYFSYDSKYLLKTISEAEFVYFSQILKQYYYHILHYPETLLQRFYGLHTMIFNDIKMYFVIMNNCFNTNIQIHYKYDLKGSSYQRLSRKIKEIDYSTYDYSVPMKDNDIRDRKEQFLLNKTEKDILIEQASIDADFLASQNINDYSFLIGVHETESKKTNRQDTLTEKIKFESIGLKYDYSFKGRKPFYENYKGGLLTKDGKKMLFIGIIDIFTEYAAKKKFEHAFKSVFQGKGISCKPPKEYCERFKAFLREIFI